MTQVSFASTQNESQTELWVSAKSHPETSVVPAALLLHAHPAWLSIRHGHAGGFPEQLVPMTAGTHDSGHSFIPPG